MSEQEKQVEITEEELKWFQNRGMFEERLLRGIFGEKFEEPSIDELRAKAQRKKGHLIRILGEPQDTVLTLPELEDRESQRMEYILTNMLDARLTEILNPQEALVLKMRFGLEDGQVRTFAEVGQAIRRSKTTAWRYENNAIRKLREATPFLKEVNK